MNTALERASNPAGVGGWRRTDIEEVESLRSEQRVGRLVPVSIRQKLSHLQPSCRTRIHRGDDLHVPAGQPGREVSMNRHIAEAYDRPSYHCGSPTSVAIPGRRIPWLRREWRGPPSLSAR